MPNNTEADRMSNGDDMSTTYLGVGGAKHDIYEADGFGSLADVTNVHRDAQSVETNADTTANAQKIDRMPRRRSKLQDLPFGIASQCSYKSNSCRNWNGSSIWYRTDVRSIMKNARMPADETGNIRTCRNESNMPNSPYRLARGHPEH